MTKEINRNHVYSKTQNHINGQKIPSHQISNMKIRWLSGHNSNHMITNFTHNT